MTPDLLYGLDIETDTEINGLDPSVSAVVAVALASSDGTQVFLGKEADLLVTLNTAISELAPGVLVTWNGAAFDMPFLADRAERIGVDLDLRLQLDPLISVVVSPLPGHLGAYRSSWGPHRHLDGFRVYRADVGRVLGLSCGLKPLARLVGLHPVEVDRTAIGDLTEQELHDYVASDAELARELVLRRWPQAAGGIDRLTD